jgi:glycosyltransferase involved in cell wall biosynthesis
MTPPAPATLVPTKAGAREARCKPCHSVLMVGTSVDVRGGISTVVRGYREGGLFERFTVRYVATHVDGGAFAKVRAALRGYAAVIVALLTLDAPLVHVHLASRASFWRKSVVCLMALLRRRPYILHVHGAEFGKFYDQECGVFARWLVRTLLTRAAFVLALADLWRVSLERIAPSARVRVLYNAVPIPGRPPRVVGVAEPERILFCGRLGPRKGTFDLIKAFARISAQFPQAQLICAGDGDIEAAKQLARELGISARVAFPGWISQEATRSELSRATVFALPSFAEGVPMALLEAMSWGVPVLTTPVGGIPEVVSSDQNGLLVKPGDVDAIERALGKLLASNALRIRLGSAARSTIIERFSLESAVAHLASIYGEFGLVDRLADSRAAAAELPVLRAANDERRLP